MSLPGVNTPGSRRSRRERLGRVRASGLPKFPNRTGVTKHADAARSSSRVAPGRFRRKRLGRY